MTFHGEDIGEDDLSKAAKNEKERLLVLEAVAACNYKNKRDKIAGILNLYPKTRDSDVALCIKYWENFQSEIYDGSDISPEKLFQLERLTTIARIRAKIQNEYKLFLASEEIQRKRRKLEENYKEVMAADIPSLPLINIYADETGKQSKYVILGSVWILESKNTFFLAGKIHEWKLNNSFKKELHFSKSGKSDCEKLMSFIDFLSLNRGYLSIKCVAFDQTRTTKKIEDILIYLYKLLTTHGMEHEVRTGRVGLPQQLLLNIDSEDSIDPIKRDEIKNTASDILYQGFGKKVILENVTSLDSRTCFYIQIADLIAGAVNRRVNYSGERGFKDDLADYIIERLGINFEENKTFEDDSFIYIDI